MVITLPENVKTILGMLNSNHYEAFIVGGCVRDSIIGTTPHDWDICTSALPQQVIEVFKKYEVIPTGLKHGTVTIILNGEQYEITTYRIDGVYEDNRHPSEVTFTDNLAEDLSRRDFTINAMAYNPYIGLVDLFGGESDIKNKTIRCVGNPNDRFNEDALRIMRAVRFATTLGYHIDDKTNFAIRKNKLLLKNIAMERINSEFTKAVRISYGFDLAELLKVVVPELTNDLIKRSVLTISNYDVPYLARLSLIFDFPIEKQTEILRRLKYDNKTIKNVIDIGSMAKEFIGQFHTNRCYIKDTKSIILEFLNRNDKVVEEVIAVILCIASTESQNELYNIALEMQKMLPQYRTMCYQISQLQINGNDLKSVGMYGKCIGNMLKEILTLVIQDEIKNEHEVLIKYVKEQQSQKAL